VAGTLNQLAAGVVANPFEERRAGWVNQAGRDGGEQVIERRLVGFVASLGAFLSAKGQAAMFGNEADVLVMSQFVRAGGERRQSSIGQGGEEVEEEKKGQGEV
jgi:hypothetical protein